VLAFIRRQKRNYRVAIARSAASSFLLSLTSQYDSIYAVALGADSVQLGTINSIGNGISALISTPLGWLVDRFGVKPFYLAGVALLAGAALTSMLASSWQVIIVATVLASVSMRLIGTGCSVICADSVQNKDRATAQNLCVTIASALSMVAPLLAAQLVTVYGGLTVEGIRPLYGIRVAGYALILVFVAARLREPRQGRSGERGARLGFVDDFKSLLKSGRSLRRWLAVVSLTWLPMAMTAPFLQLYAHEAKGADQHLLGVMATAAVLTRILFGIPFGRLADKWGRKRVIYLLTPLWYASHLLLVFSSHSASLVLAAAMGTFYSISSGLTGAMTLELVPLDRMGKWSGLIGLFRGLVTIPAPVIGGLIWRELGPAWVFLLPLAVDLCFRIPLLSTIPETLGSGPSCGGPDQ